MKKDEKILQLKIVLDHIKPAIWRRFLVKDSISFEEFHNIIQTVMGWQNYHMFEFIVDNVSIMPDDERYNLAESSFHTLFNSPEFKKMLEKNDKNMDINKMNDIIANAEKNKDQSNFDVNTPINRLFNAKNQKIKYTYDFGDSWEHEIVIEDILDKEKDKNYPICIAGERSCPPEDCGGTYGYSELLKIRKNKNHPDYKGRIVDWLGEDFDPELFVVDFVNAYLHGKEPRPVWLQGNAEIFVPLGDLLEKDDEVVKRIKSIFNHEEDYEDYLGEIEFTIAKYFLKYRKLKDKDIKNAISNIKANYTKDIGFFEETFEKEIMKMLSFVLQEEPITHHELKLVLDYVLWSIDNRSWMPDKQAYVKWLPYFFKIYTDNEMEKYRLNIIKTAKRMGIPKKHVDAMLCMGDAEVSEELQNMSKIESEFFSLDDDKKYDFVVETGLINPYLIQSYFQYLEEKNEFGTIEKLCKKLMEMSNNFPMFEFLLGLNYSNMNNPILAKFHMKNAIKAAEGASPDSFPVGDKEKILEEMRQQMRITNLE